MSRHITLSLYLYIVLQICIFINVKPFQRSNHHISLYQLRLHSKSQELSSFQNQLNIQSYEFNSSSSSSSSSSSIKYLNSAIIDSIKSLILIIATFAAFDIQPCFATTTLIDDPIYSKGLISVSPSDDFWYPPYLIGKWKASLTFKDAIFSSKISIDDLGSSKVVPGFSRYSVFPIPEMGKDIETELRFVQIDSHPREDHPFNLRNLVTAMLPSTIIDDAPYAFQLSPNWFYIPANDWNIKYHDLEGSGNVKLNTLKRFIDVNAGSVRTIEIFHEEHNRQNNDGTIESFKGDYALDWKLSVPQSLRDEFITVDNLSKAKNIQGTLNIFVYLPPTSNLYLKVPSQPVGAFQYTVDMERITGDLTKTDYNKQIATEDVEKLNYPFVPYEDGPVELDKFFGY